MYPTCPIRKETTGATEKIIKNWILENKNKKKKYNIIYKIVGNGFKFIRHGEEINKSTINLALKEI